ncbi:MAG: hypothetical protein IT430_15810 [Phycisphaerales bacterium]|nr:hypothetical protein [Phycisphaerales bacterium]
MTSAAVTYTNYLKVDELLACQRCRSADENGRPEHDEMLFIIIHQVYELWFKQVLHELDFLQTRLQANDAPAALHTFKRILTILKTLVGQVDILETMTPLSFNSFRGRLESASGFQSAQFREVEFLLGHRQPHAISAQAEGSDARQRLERRMREPALFDSFLRFLVANGFDVPGELLERDVTQRWEPSETLQQTLVKVYRTCPLCAQVCERLVDLDEGLQEWRYRHVKMVERTIGSKPGTGGSAGAEYLKQTLFRPLFPDLWAIRIHL